MRRTWLPLTAAIVMSFAGVYLSGILLGKHMRIPGTPAFLDSLCESQADNVSCDAVLNSRWGVFPPLPEPGETPADGDTDKTPRLPVAYLGLAYYTFLLAWYVAVGRPSYGGRRWQLALLGVNAGGLAFSGWFISVMFAELETWCRLCVATHAINFLIFVVNILLWPRRPLARAAALIESETTVPQPAALTGRAHPTVRLAVVAVLLAVALMRLEYGEALNSRLIQNNNQLVTALQEFRKVDAGLVAQYVQEPHMTFELRPDDAIRYDEEGAATLMVWSDFECAHCRAFGERFESQIRGQLDDQVRLVFRHYPLSNECNPYVKRPSHPNACQAARLAEAVRLQGGSEKFWEAHDILFGGQSKLKSVTAPALAEQLGLDADKLLADMDSESVKRRIAEDIEQGRKAGLKATPAIYLDGRFVSSLARDVPGFWREMGARYQQARKFSGDPQGSASPGRLSADDAADVATPGSPDRQGAR